MSTLGTLNPTLLDLVKRLNPDGKGISVVVEILNQTNEILDDMVWIEGNLPTGHKTTVRSGLPEPTWRKLYQGVQPSKSKVIQVTDACGMLHSRGVVDEALANMSSDVPAFRLSEASAHIESMGQELASTIFYGNSDTEPEKFTGLAPRFNSSTAENGGQIIKGGGSGSTNTSIWLVVWGTNTVHGIYPKGTKAGLEHKDKGVTEEADASGGKYDAYVDTFKWNCGISLRDWRHVVRICNIDVTALTKNASGSSADLVDLMTQAVETVQSLNGRAAFYCNKTIRSFLRRQVKNTSNVHLSLEDVAGKKALAFDGIPIRRVDALLNTEATVS